MAEAELRAACVCCPYSSLAPIFHSTYIVSSEICITEFPGGSAVKDPSLGQEDPLKKGKNPIDRGAWQATDHGVAKE